MASSFAERLGIEPVPDALRHGSPRQLFFLWFAANLGMPAWLVGVLGPVLGLGWTATLVAIGLGNTIASLLLGLTAAAGAGQGLAQLPLGRSLFGRRGNYLPAFLNFLSSLGWYTANTAVGGAVLSHLLGWNLALSMFLIALVQVVISYLGYDAIHRVEKWMAYIQAVLFLAMSVAAWGKFGGVHPGPATHAGSFLIEVAAVASYSFSWSPYASDYARYLPLETSRRAVFWNTFWGSWLSTVWVECIGSVVGALGWGNGQLSGMLSRLMGGWTFWADLAVVFGTITANVLNGYTATLSLLTLDFHLARRWGAVLLGFLGALLAWWASAHLMEAYKNFLLLLSYWVAPWVGVVLVGYWRGLLTRDRALTPPATHPAALGAFVIGILAVIPFMSTALWTGPVAHRLNGGDLGYYVGIILSALLFWAAGAKNSAAR